MSRILRDTSGSIYRWNGSILRTPIIKRLYPDQKKLCQIGDPHSRVGDVLKRGFTGGNTWYNVVQSVGHQMLNYMINGNPLWIDAWGAHDPEFVWYQGAYSTSAQTIQQGKWMSEAYAQFPGFHFTLPSLGSPWVISAVRVYFLNMGVTRAFGPAIDKNANNTNIANDPGWQGGNDWTVHFHVLNTPTCNYHPMDIINNFPSDAINIWTSAWTGQYRGYRDLRMNAPLGTVDGCIPTLTTPIRNWYDMYPTQLAHFTQNGAGWIVPMFHPYMNPLNPTEDYRPYYVDDNSDGTNNYWGCASLRDVYIDVMFDVP